MVSSDMFSYESLISSVVLFLSGWWFFKFLAFCPSIVLIMNLIKKLFYFFQRNRQSHPSFLVLKQIDTIITIPIPFLFNSFPRSIWSLLSISNCLSIVLRIINTILLVLPLCLVSFHFCRLLSFFCSREGSPPKSCLYRQGKIPSTKVTKRLLTGQWVPL